jgi:hypothetical protein
MTIQATEEDHPDKKEILNAINTMTEVASAINEYKRRTDLGQKNAMSFLIESFT